MTLSDHSKLVEIRLSIDFQSQFKFLKKRYRKIKVDIQSTLDDLESGKTPGDQFSGIDSIVMKVRVKNSDIQKGKSGGYRLIYWVVSPELIVLLDIYSKSDQENITLNEVRQIIKNFKKSQEKDSGNDDIEI
jgi:mRNA-degrading endonuclease RelE of RelBE toxin-antitoxin system